MSRSTSNEQIKYPNRWAKGVSGNYRGRPKIDPKIRKLAEEKSEHAIYCLTRIIMCSSVPPDLQALASMFLLDLAFNSSKARRHYLRKVEMTFDAYLAGRPRPDTDGRSGRYPN
jgi:hypothetical protein